MIKDHLAWISDAVEPTDKMSVDKFISLIVKALHAGINKLTS